MKHYQKSLFLFCVVVFVYVLLQVIPCFKTPSSTSFTGPKKPKVIAHGGSKALFPENSVFAFEEVRAYGVDGVEVDLRLSKDNYVVGVHDEKIDAYTNHQGYVYEYTYAQLLSMNFGYYFEGVHKDYPFRAPSASLRARLVPVELRQLLTMYPKNMLFILEIKDGGARGKKIADIVRSSIVSLGIQKWVSVCSFEEDIMDYYEGQNNTQSNTVMDYQSSRDFVVASYYGYDFFMNFKHDGLMLPREARSISLDDRYLIYKAHRHRKFVYYWTIDDPTHMRSLIRLGVDGIISDRVDVLQEVLRE